METIKYHKIKGKYKYELDEDYSFYSGVFGWQGNVKNKWVSISLNGLMTIKAGYQWDGCSGPTIDTTTTMRAGLVHDAGYQLIRERILPLICANLFDTCLKNIMIEDGACRFRAWYYFKAVNNSIIHNLFAKPKN